MGTLITHHDRLDPQGSICSRVVVRYVGVERALPCSANCASRQWRAPAPAGSPPYRNTISAPTAEVRSPRRSSSYPHPWLMPDFWQFPTVSMGLGPLMAIYQARFMKYLDGRGLADTARKVWASAATARWTSRKAGAIGWRRARSSTT